MKHVPLALFIIVLLLSGCGQTNEPEPTEEFMYLNKTLYEEYVENGIQMAKYAENDSIPHIKWSYQGNQFNYDTNEYWDDPMNLTETNDPEHVHVRFGWRILKSYEEYTELISFVEQKQQRVRSEIGVYDRFKILLDTMDMEIDEVFFESHNLAVIDYCNEGSTFLRTRLEEVDPGFWGSNVGITISKEEDTASTASLPGEVYFIPIPKRCVILDVEYIRTAWERS